MGVSHNTINRGLAELGVADPSAVRNTQSRQRKVGRGRKKKIDQSVWEEIEKFINPHTQGEPVPTLQWASKSLRHIAPALKKGGIHVSNRIVGDALKECGFNLQSNRKRFGDNRHEDRDAQFEFIQKKVDKYISEGQPIISVDAKKRELAGNFANKGVEWHPQGMAESVNTYDFQTAAEVVAIPYRVYEIKENIGWVNVVITKDTASFSVQSIRNWWYKSRSITTTGPTAS